MKEDNYSPNDALSSEINPDLYKTVLFQALVDNDTCTTFFKIILCFYFYLPCDVMTYEVLPLCDTRCSELDMIFEECDKTNSLPLVLDSSGFFTPGYNCSNPRTYYFNNIPYKISNSSCSKLH